MLLCRNLQPIAVFHQLAKRRVFHNPALSRKEPGFIYIFEQRVLRLHHEIEFAIVGIEAGDQIMCVYWGWCIGSGVGECLLPSAIDLRGFCHRQRQGKLGGAGYTNIITDLPVNLVTDIEARAGEVCGNVYWQRENHFALIIEGNQIAAGKRRPFGCRPNDIPCRSAARQLPFAGFSRLTAITTKLPVGMPVLDRVQENGEPQRLTGNHMGGFRNKLDFNLISFMNLCLDASSHKKKYHKYQTVAE